ncbi:putative phage protein (TIGR02216 family) [Maritalea mobilis]|uniref:Putative phage protein (TIGR02216 family) n=1 Tax=Maritalea mobilis TaxID=483324 RepID=A0A4R6VNP4_9HYPH|nr:rcc01693 family protein [Maritalea mobilis]TDQ63820.1 putative phage protein (TIGR02216 family) [Maritalea mobilis]
MVKSPFPWAELAQIGFGELRLSPEAFWASSPRELTLAVQAKQKMFGHAAPLERQRMAELMADFPDGDKYES